MNTKELSEITIIGAREHNLKNVNLVLPKNKLIVFTGVSGSGKTTLAMDTLYAEGQRRYVESLSSYARQFLGVLKKPEVDSIFGLSPSIAIDQKSISTNPRSTVGTMTEIYDFLRLLFARIGHPHCSNCGREISQLSKDQIIDRIISSSLEKKGSKNIKFLLLAPLVKDKKGEYTKLFLNLKAQGYKYVRVDGVLYSLASKINLIKTNSHSIEVVIDRFVLNTKEPKKDIFRLTSSVENCLNLGGGFLILSFVNDLTFDFPEFPKNLEDHLFSQKFSCPVCNISQPLMEPRNFSFNSPHGACVECEGIGNVLKVDLGLIINESLSINQGGIFPYAKSIEYKDNVYLILLNLAKKYNFSLDEPINKLNPKILELLLNGEENGDYEGLIKSLEERHKRTNSDYVRGEIEKYMYKDPCKACLGTRLKPESLSVTIDSLNIYQVGLLDLSSLKNWVNSLDKQNKLSNMEKSIATPIVLEIKTRLDFLLKVGLSYININRASATLSGGEAQRIRLASQIGSGLSGVLYILDEPSIGLHSRDQEKLIKTLKDLRDLGNTVIVVEHDAQTIKSADYVVDFGPGAGRLGGNVIAQGTPIEITNNKNSLTGLYLAGRKKVSGTFYKDQDYEVLVRNNKNESNDTQDKNIKILNCTEHNLKNISVTFPLGKLTCVTGVSGSGKSTLVAETLLSQIRYEMGLKVENRPGKNKGVVGIEHIDKVINIDQSPIGKTPRSNPATYTKAFDHIRDLFALTKEARIRGYQKGAFSFNVKGGRCEACQGEGVIKIEMQFMPDVYIDCEVCKGTRYTREVLEIDYKGKNITEVLKMTVEEALSFFENISPIRRKLKMLVDVGLSYIELGQSAPTLSGGESQRVKLASELSKIQTGKTLYILDEPTTGLHFADLDKLIGILKKLVYYKNTVIVVEHNLDLIKNADYIIDLGPEGGEAGGEVIYAGELSGILKTARSHTGKMLKQST